MQNPLLSLTTKLSDIIYKPIEILSDYTKESIKKAEHKRNIELLEREKSIDAEVRIKEKESESKLKINEIKVKTDEAIREKTEIVRIISEIKQIEQDKNFERNIKLVEAIKKYQSELMKISLDSIISISNLSIELKEKASGLIDTRREKYITLQSKIIDQCSDKLKEIENKFPDESNRGRVILENAIEKQLVSVIENATKLIDGLDSELKTLDNRISLLISSAQSSVEKNLEQFRLMDSINPNQVKLLEDGNTINVEYNEI